MKQLSLRAEYLLDSLDLPAATGVEDAQWEHFQLQHLSDDSTFRIENKARQIAWSWTVAAEAIAEAHLQGDGTIFVSINQEEAAEKIRYARQIHEAISLAGTPRLIRDSVMSMEFDNGARLISLPSRPPRGKARMNVVLDEFAHVQRDRDVYTAALPVISKGGRLRIGSSPRGASGVFWEVAEQKLRKYPGYRRKRTPWWEVAAFCVNVAAARKQAPALTTEQRVELFGNDRIRAIYANMPEDDFRQEYECEIVDETTAWISWDLIRRNQEAFEAGHMRWYRASNVDDALALIPLVLEAIAEGQIEASLAGGIDIGRKKDLSELVAIGRTTDGRMPLRIAVSLDRVEFDDQAACFTQMIERLPFTNVLVDQTGIGNQLAEHLEKTGKATGVTFTNQTKALWAIEAKLQAERSNVPLPPDREIAYQVHSIRKTTTAARNEVYDTEANEKHHADKFWAWSLAIYAAQGSAASFVVRYT